MKADYSVPITVNVDGDPEEAWFGYAADREKDRYVFGLVAEGTGEFTMYSYGTDATGPIPQWVGSLTRDRGHFFRKGSPGSPGEIWVGVEQLRSAVIRLGILQLKARPSEHGYSRDEETVTVRMTRQHQRLLALLSRSLEDNWVKRVPALCERADCMEYGKLITVAGEDAYLCADHQAEL